MAKTTPRFRDVLEALGRHQVDYIVVGGVAAVLNGAPIATFDLDIVHARDSQNLDRLLSALTEIEAHYRDQTGRQLPPVRELLAGPGHNLMSTKFGPLDLLGTVGAGQDWQQLLPHAIELKLGGLLVRVLDLATLIALKEHAARDKDLAVLAILRRTLAERGK